MLQFNNKPCLACTYFNVIASLLMWFASDFHFSNGCQFLWVFFFTVLISLSVLFNYLQCISATMLS